MKVDPVMDGTNLEDEKCEVRNLSCVAFPTKMQCQGIAMGGCVGKFFFREIKGKKNLRFHEFFFFRLHSTDQNVDLTTNAHVCDNGNFCFHFGWWISDLLHCLLQVSSRKKLLIFFYCFFCAGEMYLTKSNR